MPRRSAGLLVYRSAPGPARRRALPAGGPDGQDGEDGRDAGVEHAGAEVLLVHPGGPYWARRDAGWWSIPKGEVAEDEDDLQAARREFEEELGLPPPDGPALALGEIVQKGGKRVVAWAVAGDVDASKLVPGTFEMEWPPGSGRRQRFPEVDRAGWFSLADASEALLAGQRPFLARLSDALTGPGRVGR